MSEGPDKRRWFRWKLRTLFVAMAILGGIFAVSAKWPVSEQIINTTDPSAPWVQAQWKRLPTLSEVTVRAVASVAALAAGIAAVSVVRRSLS